MLASRTGYQMTEAEIAEHEPQEQEEEQIQKKPQGDPGLV